MIILTSASPRRRDLLAQLGLDFVVRAQDCEEISSSTDPAEYVVDIAQLKARAALESALPDDIIIAADTVVCLDDEILGKPRDLSDAGRMLCALSGKIHTVRTGVCVIIGGVEKTFCSATSVEFFDLEDAEISNYLATGEPMGKAGAYAIQGKGATLVRRISGDYNNVVGLPLAEVWRAIK